MLKLSSRSLYQGMYIICVLSYHRGSGLNSSPGSCPVLRVEGEKCARHHQQNPSPRASCTAYRLHSSLPPPDAGPHAVARSLSVTAIRANTTTPSPFHSENVALS